MIPFEKLKQEVKLFKDDETSLYSCLVSFAKESNLDGSFDNFYEQFLFDQRPDIRKAAVFSLLFCSRSQKNIHINKTVEFLIDKNEDSDLRIMSASSLGQALFGSNDKKTMKMLYKVFIDEKYSFIGSACLAALLKIIGVSTRDMFFRGFDSSTEMNDDIEAAFSSELKLIKKVVNS
ncbi:MAG: hypothetical protein AAGA64_18965 [Bacteroidota bacterium]